MIGHPDMSRSCTGEQIIDEDLRVLLDTMAVHG